MTEKLNLERADCPEILLFVFPVILFCEGRIGVFSREGSAPPRSPRPSLFPEVWGAAHTPPLLVQAGALNFKQTNKGIVSISVLTIKPGSLILHVLEFGVWD